MRKFQIVSKQVWHDEEPFFLKSRKQRQANHFRSNQTWISIFVLQTPAFFAPMDITTLPFVYWTNKGAINSTPVWEATRRSCVPAARGWWEISQSTRNTTRCRTTAWMTGMGSASPSQTQVIKRSQHLVISEQLSQSPGNLVATSARHQHRLAH